MALNVESTGKLAQRMTQQSALAAHTARLLANYRKQLGAAWSGEECQYIELAIDGLIRQCPDISTRAESIERDIVRAIEDILAEEAQNHAI